MRNAIAWMAAAAMALAGTSAFGAIGPSSSAENGAAGAGILLAHFPPDDAPECHEHRDTRMVHLHCRKGRTAADIDPTGCMADHRQEKCQPRLVIRERAGPNEEECEIFNHNHPECPLFKGVKPSWW